MNITRTQTQHNNVKLQASPVYEMLLSIYSLKYSNPNTADWIYRIKQRLNPELIRQISDLFGPLGEGLSLLELAIDYQDHLNLPGFLTYIESLSEETFLWYVWGRIVPKDQMRVLMADEKKALKLLSQFNPRMIHDETFIEKHRKTLLDPSATMQTLCTTLHQYWQKSFKYEVQKIKPLWFQSIHEVEDELGQQETMKVVRKLTSGRDLPVMYPPNYRLENIQLVPSFLLPQDSYIIYGYGSIVIFYRINKTLEEDLIEAPDNIDLENVILVARALGDKQRLTILQALARGESMYGKKLAGLCGISAPAISRHMGILKDAGLISERIEDNRSYYSFNNDQLKNFTLNIRRLLET